MKDTCADSARFCLGCKSFLPNDMFKPGGRRTLCRMHFNQRNREKTKRNWIDRPQERQAKIVWQVAYIDSLKIFKQKMNITPAMVLDLFQQLKLPLTAEIRLVPPDPTIPLSIGNCCLTSRSNRKEMCVVWRRLKDKHSYGLFMLPSVGRPIYAISKPSIVTNDADKMLTPVNEPID